MDMVEWLQLTPVLEGVRHPDRPWQPLRDKDYKSFKLQTDGYNQTLMNIDKSTYTTVDRKTVSPTYVTKELKQTNVHPIGRQPTVTDMY